MPSALQTASKSAVTAGSMGDSMVFMVVLMESIAPPVAGVGHAATFAGGFVVRRRLSTRMTHYLLEF